MKQDIRFCTAPDGVRIAYATVGKGPPLVTATNGLNHLEFDWNSPVWRHQLGELSRHDYKMVVVTTLDGRTYLGNVSGENERQLTLRVVGQEVVVINKSDIQSRDVTAVSLMPEGLLQTLTDTEVLDLVAYLRTPEQVVLPTD